MSVGPLEQSDDVFYVVKKFEFKRFNTKICIEREGLRLVTTGKELFIFHKGIKGNLIGLL